MIIKKICEFTGIKESSEMYEINTENHNIGNYKKILHRKDIDLIQKQLQDIINEYNKIILV